MIPLTRRIALPTLNEAVRIVPGTPVWKRVVVLQVVLPGPAPGVAAVSDSPNDLALVPSGPGSFAFLLQKATFVLPPNQALYAAQIAAGATHITIQVSESAPEEV